MANTDRPSGFRPVGTLSGGLGALGFIQRCLVDEDDSTVLAVNDIVKLTKSDESNGMPTVAAVTAGDTAYGVVVGFENWDNGRDSSVTQTLEKPRIRTASVRGYALVAISPDLIMEAQVSSDAALADGDIGGKANVLATAPDSDAQVSQMEIDNGSSTSIAATATYDMHILQLLDKPDNALGTHAKVLCTFNIHELGRGIYDGALTAAAATGHLGVHE